MKRIVHYGLLLMLAIVTLISSCQEDEFTELDATREQLTFEDSIQSVRDSLEAVGGIIDYSINLVAASGAGFINGSNDRPEGDPSLAGIAVTISQHGTTQSTVTDSSGIAAFADLRVGTVSISVDDDEYTNVDAIVYLTTNLDSIGLLSGVGRQAATLIPLFSTTQQLATIEGRVTFEDDLTDTLVQTAAAGINVGASIDFEDDEFREDYFSEAEFYESSDCGNCKEIAKIVNMAYIDATLTATTDASGNYTLQVPSTANGLPIQVEVSEFAADQTLLMEDFNGDEINGPITVRTIFGTELDGDQSDVPTDLPRALAFIDAPTGITADPPADEAEASATLTESGVASITIVDQGYGYTQPPRLIIDDPYDPFGTTAQAEAFLTDGRVTSVVVTETGSGYVIDNPGVSAEDFLDNPASATPLVTYGVVEYENTQTGQGYTSEPIVTVTSGEGSGASARAILDGTVIDVTVDNQGSGYVLAPEVNFVGEADDEATATSVTMTTYNPIRAIELTDNFTEKFEDVPTVTITEVGSGSGARGIVQLNTSEGVLGRIAITNVGSGYDQAPAVFITGGGGQGAVADADINTLGEIVAINILDEGFGYTSTPTVEIAAPLTGGVQATADAFLAFEIDDIILTNPGSGYDIGFGSDFPIDDGDGYTNEPTITLTRSNGTSFDLDGDEVIVRPSMSVESIGFTGGSGYQAAPTVVFTPVLGYGSGAAATAEVEFEIDELEVITTGSDYEFSSDVIVVVGCDDCDQVAEFQANLGDGVLTSITLDDGGEEYQAPPNVRLSNGFGTYYDVDVDATISGDAVNGFTINDGMDGLDYLPFSNNFAIEIDIFIGPVDLEADVITGAGQVSHVTIDDAGSGYSVAPVVEFNNDGTGGSGAAATARIEEGRVVEITLTNPGSNYVSTPDVALVLPTYTRNATADVDVDNDGFVTDVSIDDEGEGYVSIPGVTIQPIIAGRGSGATAKVSYIENGRVQDAFVTNQGSGYTGRNIPEGSTDVEIFGGNESLDFEVFTDKTYVRDIYLGTGQRTTEDFEDYE